MIFAESNGCRKRRKNDMRDCDKQYEEYLESHIKSVEKAYTLLWQSIKKMGLSDEEFQLLESNIKSHDKSKFTEEEFVPYSNYFYGDKTEEVVKEFKAAAIIHEKRNPHHLEYWIEREKEMPTIYLIEMVCDWWSFSLQKNRPNEIFDWYNKKKTKMKLGDREQVIINFLFEEIRNLGESLVQV